MVTTTPSPVRARLLERVELFAGLSARELARVGRLFTIIDVAAGRTLARQGDACREFTVIVDGSVAVSVDGVPLAVLEGGHHFGALPLLDPLRETGRRASFHALAPTRIAVANRSEFATMRKEFPVVETRARSLAVRRLAYFALVHEQPAGRTVEVAGYPVALEPAG